MESIIFVLDGRKDLVKSILSNIGIGTTLGSLNQEKFSDGELSVDYLESVRGKRVYLLTSPNNSDEIIKLTLAIDAARRAGAEQIIPILPFFPYQRGDKKDAPRGPIGAKVISNILERCGATSLITFDLHADQIQGFLDFQVTTIEGKHIFDDYIASLDNENLVLAGPDAGSGKRVKRMRDRLAKHHNISLNYIMLDKTRSVANEVDEIFIIGDVTGKDVLIIDDMIDTFGTADKAVNVLLENGAKSVRMVASHGVLSGPAFERITKTKLTELVISDSLALPINETHPAFNKIKVVNIGRQLAMAMIAINNNNSFEQMNK